MHKLVSIALGALALSSSLLPAHTQKERTIESLAHSEHYELIIQRLNSLRATLPLESTHHGTLDELLEETHELMERENELKELRVRLRPYFERQQRILRTMQQHEDRQSDYVKRLKELHGLLDQDPL